MLTDLEDAIEDNNLDEFSYDNDTEMFLSNKFYGV